MLVPSSCRKLNLPVAAAAVSVLMKINRVEKAPPKFGEHNREVLRDAGYNDADIAGFEKEGITAKGT